MSSEALLCSKIHYSPKSYYCIEASCMKAVCPECYIEKHEAHEKKKLKDLYEEKKKLIERSLKPLLLKQSEYQLKEKFVQEEIKKAKKRESGKKSKIKSFTYELTQALEAEAKRFTLKMENWAANEIKQPLEES